MAATNPKVVTGARGAVLYICDAPPNLDFGIDCMNYETGPNFRGLSMIPPGLHFVYFSTGLGSRQGFFIQCEENDFIVRSWDTQNEEITADNVLSEASMLTLRQALQKGELNHQLGPYPFAQHHTWLNLSSHVSMSVLARTECSPGNNIIPGVAEDLEHLSSSSPTSTKMSTEVKLYFPGLARVARFADMSTAEASLREATNQSPSEGRERASLLTSLYMDKTAITQHLVLSYFDNSWSELMGEMQLAFVLFFLVFSHPALVYWKNMVNLVCSSEKLMRQQVTFTAAFIKSLHAQLNFSPEDFFEVELSRDNFLRPALSALFAALGSGDVPDPLPEYVRRLLKFVKKKFDLYESTSEHEHEHEHGENKSELYNLVGEDMPVIVDERDICSVTYARGNGNGSVSVSGSGSGDGDNADRSSTSTRTALEEQQQQHQEMAKGLQQRWSVFDSMVGSSPLSTAETGHVMDTPRREVLDDDDANVVMSGQELGAGTVDTTATQLSPTQIEEGLFSWRYPLLFEANQVAAGKEDFVMTAARIVSEYEQSQSNSNSQNLLLHVWREATMFIENEHKLRQR